METSSKHVLISGASGGLGMAIAKQLLLEGNNVVLLANKNSARLNQLKKDFPENVKLIEADLTVENNWENLADRIGNVDVLVNAIGVSSAGMSWKIPTEEWRRVFQLNVDVPFRLAQLVIPTMREQKFGRIIFFSSVVAQKGILGTSAYAASKSALIGLTRTMSVELISSKITVNCIAPGYMEAGMINELTHDFKEKIILQIPAGGLGSTQNICNAVSFLANEKSDYITGQVISLNGGMT